MLGHHVPAVGDRRRGRGADDVAHAHDREDVRRVAPADALDVVGVDGAPIDGRHRLVQLARLVDAVGVHRDLDVVGVGDGERLVDHARIARVVLVHLEPARARLDLPDQRIGHRARRPAEDAQVDRLVLEGLEHPAQVEGRVVVEAARDQGRHARGERDGNEPRLDEVHVRVDPARRRDEALAVHRRGGRADQQIRIVHDVRIAGPPHADDQPVLHPDARLADAEHGIDDDDVADQEVELARRGQAVVHHEAGAERLPPAAQDLVAVARVVALDQGEEVRVAEADAVARGGPVARRVLLPADLIGHEEDPPCVRSRRAARARGPRPRARRPSRLRSGD